MGGGRRGDRHRYARGMSGGPTLDDYNKEKTTKRVFISFHMEDEAQVELLRQQAKDERYDVEFIDYSIKEPFDERWKTQATERIRQSSVFICMIGPETYKREAVIWEINKAYELGKKVIGVRIYRNSDHKIPKPLVDNNVKIIDWNLKDIVTELERK
jgi:DNA-dependent RNA polymerase auxiliary subunit epsilon